MNTTIRNATAADASAIAQVHYDALDAFHDFYAAFFQNHPRVTLKKSTQKALTNPENHFLIAETEQGRIAGFVRYTVHESAPSTQEVKEEITKDPEPKATEPSLFAIKDHLKDLWDKFDRRQEEIETCYKKAANNEKHIFVWHLMIDPAYQRQGIGNKLLSTVVKTADDENICTFLVSSRESHGLYQKLGFTDLGCWKIDNGHWVREIQKIEGENEANSKLVETFDGAEEIEHVMIRKP